MRTTVASVCAGIWRIASSRGTRVPRPRTWRTMGPRFTVSVQTVERSTLGAAGFSRITRNVTAARTTTPTAIVTICRLRFLAFRSGREISIVICYCMPGTKAPQRRFSTNLRTLPSFVLTQAGVSLFNCDLWCPILDRGISVTCPDQGGYCVRTNILECSVSTGPGAPISRRCLRGDTGISQMLISKLSGYRAFPGKIRVLPTSPDPKTVERYGAPGSVGAETSLNFVLTRALLPGGNLPRLRDLLPRSFYESFGFAPTPRKKREICPPSAFEPLETICRMWLACKPCATIFCMLFGKCGFRLCSR